MPNPFVLRISKEGKSALYDGDEDMVFTSDCLVPKVPPGTPSVTIGTANGNGTHNYPGLLTGTLEYTFTSNPGFGTQNLLVVPHGLGYVPAGLIFIYGYATQFQAQLPISLSPAGFERFYGYLDSTNLVIQLIKEDDGFGFETYPDLTGAHFLFKYFIFVEEGA